MAYFSKKLNKHQQAFPITEKEALAFVLAVKHLEVYVASSEKVVVYSDTLLVRQKHQYNVFCNYVYSIYLSVC